MFIITGFELALSQPVSIRGRAWSCCSLKFKKLNWYILQLILLIIRLIVINHMITIYIFRLIKYFNCWPALLYQMAQLELSVLCVDFSFCAWVRMLATKFGVRQHKTACYYGPCDWQHVGEKVTAEVCLWWRGPSGDRMFSRQREICRSHRTDDSSLTPHSLLFVYFSHLQPEAADSKLSPSCCTVLKDSTCLASGQAA